MITVAAPDHEHANVPHAIRTRPVALVHAAALVAAFFAASPARAQIALTTATAPTLLDQATPLPRGTFRFRATEAWSRIDGWFDGNGNSHPLGSAFTSDSAGVTQIPALAISEAYLQALTGDANTHLSLGRLTTAATTRIAQIPLALDYGMTSRLTLSVVVPFVQTRSRVGITLNNTRADSVFANVGVNPQDYASSSIVASDFASAGQSLAAQVQQCQANPAGAGCGAIDADPSSAAALATTLQSFGAGVSAIYGTDNSTPGAAFVPLAGSALLGTINGRIASLNQAYRGFTGQDVTNGTLGGAASLMATGDLERILADRATAGYDSLGTVERLWMGDVQLGATWLLVAPTTDTMATARWRGALQGFVHLPTGHVSNGTHPFDVGTGDGRPEADLRALFDAAYGRHLALSLGAQYLLGFGSIDAGVLPNATGQFGPVSPLVNSTWTPGNAMQLDVSPRFLVTDELSLDGYWSMRHRGDDKFVADVASLGTSTVTVAGATEQRLGLGFGYAATTSLGSHTLPIDARFVHLETVSASGGPAFKSTRDEVRVRLYY